MRGSYYPDDFLDHGEWTRRQILARSSLLGRCDDRIGSDLSVRTFSVAPIPPNEIASAKRARNVSISVVLPALNEQRTIGAICEVIRSKLIETVVDELIVIDSGSDDDTIEVARAAGATVYRAKDLTDIGTP